MNVFDELDFDLNIGSLKHQVIKLDEYTKERIMRQLMFTLFTSSFCYGFSIEPLIICRCIQKLKSRLSFLR